MNTKQLMLFVESLYDRGLLVLPLDKFNYEWVCYDYLNDIERDKSITYFNFNEQKELSLDESRILKNTARRLISSQPSKL